MFVEKSSSKVSFSSGTPAYFSVSNLTVTPDEVWQYDKITINFRVDNWDRYNAYNNVPVSVWLNGVCVYTGSEDTGTRYFFRK